MKYTDINCDNRVVYSTRTLARRPAGDPVALPRPSTDPVCVSRRGAAHLMAAISYVVACPQNAAAKTQPTLAGDWSSPGLANSEQDAVGPRFYTTPSRVKVQELSQGQGPSANIGDKLLLDFVLRRSNGYFIYGTVEGVSFQPRDIPTGPILLSMVGLVIGDYFIMTRVILKH